MTMMMMENEQQQQHHLTGALFAVVFFDGEREIDLGSILITQSMNFKEFQSLISHKIGISPHQITTYFTPLHQNNHHHRRRPVTNKFDFAGILPESTTTFFWVVLKRSRRVRRRRPKPTGAGEPLLPENFVLLRRNPNFEYMDLIREQVERERYMMSLNLNSDVYSDLSLYSSSCGIYGNGFVVGSDDGGSSSGAGSEVFCGVCWNARMEGETAPFHCCKNDAVAKDFRSPAGPIGPPAKNKLR